MSKIKNAMYEIYELDELSERNIQINAIHPLVKLLITLIYITCVLWVNKYSLFGLLPMILYPMILFRLSELSVKVCLRKLCIVLPMICLIGIFNPIFDKRMIYQLFGFTITTGMISMITLILKGIYTFMASYLLMAITGIERLCYALKLLPIPDIIVTQILLVYRYITVLMKEANAVFEAYSLRAPNEKGVKYKIWGSLIGQLLFRSIDRAENLYDSMLLRGFHGEFYYAFRQKFTKYDYIYFLLWLIIIVALRILNIEELIKHL